MILLLNRVFYPDSHKKQNYGVCVCVFCNRTPFPGLRNDSLLGLCLCLDLQILHHNMTKVSCIR